MKLVVIFRGRLSEVGSIHALRRVYHSVRKECGVMEGGGKGRGERGKGRGERGGKGRGERGKGGKEGGREGKEERGKVYF